MDVESAMGMDGNSVKYGDAVLEKKGNWRGD